MIQSFLVTLLVVSGISSTICIGQAGPLKVDIGGSDRNDAPARQYVKWRLTGGQASREFGGVTVTLRNGDTNQAAPGAEIYKSGLDSGARMACDGAVVRNGSLEMVVSGLAAGQHTIATYHNSLWSSNRLAGGFDVYVNGSLKLTNIQPSVRVAKDLEATSLFIRVTAEKNRDVILRFTPVGARTTNTAIILNGFEIDAGNPLTKAVKPTPADDDEHVDGDAGSTTLTWTPPTAAVSHLLYFGTNKTAVAAAGPKSPLFRGSQKTVGWTAGNLSQFDEYFWRVDEVDASGNVTTGDVWSFRTSHLAFPTAEGYGRLARGGRGGRTIEVTTLEDYDTGRGEAVIPGSYRAAVEAEGPRTIVFRVSGLIRLKRPCAVHNPYCTIAGQTAPGDGICVANYSSGAYGTHDVIIRFMRFRVGDATKRAMDGCGLSYCDNSIIDHCSISWSSDEGTSSRGAHNITFQRNLVAEPLHHSYHYATHAFGGSISGNIGSYHHNLLAHCTDRNWSLAGGYNQGGMYDGFLDIRNNVVYNWTARTTDGGVMELNYVNNYYKPNPTNPFVKWLLKLDPVVTSHGTPKYYMAGNVMEGFDYEADNWKAFHNGPQVEKLVRVNQPLFESYVKTHSAQEAYTNVILDVGATFPRQDVIDRRIIEEARMGTTHYTGTNGPTFKKRPGRNFAGIIDAPTDNKDALGSANFPWPEYRTYNVPVDSDHDGMPDDWEARRGLNPNDKRDANGDRDSDGYTNLEEYLGWLVGEFSGPEKLSPDLSSPPATRSL